MRRWCLTTVAVVALLACPVGQTPGQPARSGTPTPTGPVLRLGALLPLNGPGAWFGAEIQRGLELAAAEVDPATVRGASSTAEGTIPEAPAPPDEREPKARAQAPLPAPDRPAEAGAKSSTPAATADAGRPAPDAPAEAGAESDTSGASADASPPASDASAEAGAESATSGTTTDRSRRRPVEPVEPDDRPRTITLVLQAVDVQPLDVREAETEVNRLLGSGVTAVVTASPTPTLTVLPLATARNVLVLHAGLATERFPGSSRTLLQLRPSPAARADVLAAYAWGRGTRRLAVLVGGDAFGRAVRTAVAARWQKHGGRLAHEESLSLDASDLRSRLRAVVRSGAEAVVLGYEGPALGEAARALRGAGYAGQLMAMDDDRAALLVGGRALEGAQLLTDAFVPLLGSRGARFARAYEAKHGRPPSRFAASAYEVATLLVERAQRSLQEGRGTAGSRLREGLASGPFPSLYAGELMVRDDGTVSRPLALLHVSGDRMVFDTYVSQDGRVVSPLDGGLP